MIEQACERAESAQRLYEDFCSRLDDIASRMDGRMPDVDIAGAFCGTGLNVLVNTIGREGAIAYLRNLAIEIENDASPDGGVN